MDSQTTILSCLDRGRDQHSNKSKCQSTATRATASRTPPGSIAYLKTTWTHPGSKAARTSFGTESTRTQATKARSAWFKLTWLKLIWLKPVWLEFAAIEHTRLKNSGTLEPP